MVLFALVMVLALPLINASATMDGCKSIVPSPTALVSHPITRMFALVRESASNTTSVVVLTGSEDTSARDLRCQLEEPRQDCSALRRRMVVELLPDHSLPCVSRLVCWV